MGKGEQGSVEKRTGSIITLGCSVETVSEHRMAGRRKMNPDLVGPASHQTADRDGGTWHGRLDEVYVGCGGAAVGGDVEAPTVAAITPDRVGNYLLGEGGPTLDRGDVDSLDLALAPRLCEGLQRLRNSGEEQDATRQAIEAVDEAEERSSSVAPRESLEEPLVEGGFSIILSRLRQLAGGLVSGHHPAVVE
jgi:hypothetical protein